MEARLGTISGDPSLEAAPWTAEKWEDDVNTNPEVGATEVWEFYNATGDAHRCTFMKWPSGSSTGRSL